MADDIVIRISAKDLSKRSFQETIRNVAGVGDATEKTKRKTDSLDVSFGKLVGGLVTGAAVIGAARKAWDLLAGSIAEGIQLNAVQERAVNKLNQALENQGTHTPELSAQYQQLASDLQNLSIHGDEALIDMQALLIQVGDVGPDMMERALQATVDLSAGLDRDLRTSAEVVAKALSGNIGALKEYGIVVPEARFEAEGMAAVLDVLNDKFGGQAQAQIEDTIGKWTQFQNALGDTKEVLGDTVEATGLLDLAIGFLSDKNEAAARNIGLFREALELSKRALDGDAEARERLLTTTTNQIIVEGQLEEQLNRATLEIESRLGSVSSLELQTTSAAAAEAAFADTNRELLKSTEELRQAEEARAEILEALRAQEDELTRTAAARTATFEELIHQAGRFEGVQLETVEATAGLGAELDHLLTPIQDVELAIRDAHEILAEFAVELGTEAPPTFFDSLLSDLKSSILDFDFGGLIVGAFQGGGDVGKTIGAALGNEIAGALSRQLTSALGSSIGGLVGGFLGPLGAIGGSLLGGLFDNLGGPDEAELAGRELVRVFENEIISGLSESQLAEAAGERWRQVVVGIRDFFVEAGFTAAEGEAAVQTMWDAIKDGGPDAVQAAIDSIRSVVGEVEAARLETELLAAESATDYDAMAAAAEKYGISVHALGPAFKQARIDDDAQAILADFELLKSGGANVEKVLTGMADEVQEFLTRSKKFGTDVPADMRPMLEDMVELGLLVDEDGEKLEDLSGINFAESIEEGVGRVADSMELLVGKIGDLIDKIGDVSSGVQGIPDVEVGVRLNVDDSELRNLPEGTVPEFDMGTRLRFENFRRQGTVAVLHGEEAVLRRTDVSPLAAEIASVLGPRMSSGGEGGGRSVVVVNAGDRGRLRSALGADELAVLDRLMRGGELAIPSSGVGDRI